MVIYLYRWWSQYERYFDELNESNLGNYLNDIWFTFITMTTVGYGDIFPVSVAGKIVTMISSFMGIAIVALPAGIITTGLS